MVKIGFLHFINAPTEEAQKAIPEDIDPPPLEKGSKTVLLFCHDESTFQCNDYQTLQWGSKGSKMIKPKRKVLESWFLTLLINTMDFLPSMMKNTREQKPSIPISKSTHESF